MKQNQFPPGQAGHVVHPGQPLPGGHPASGPRTFVRLGHLRAEFWKCRGLAIKALFTIR